MTRRLPFAFVVLVWACGGSPAPFAPLGPSEPLDHPPEQPTPPPPPLPTPEPGIYVANADGSNARRLSAGSGPAWSPDGTRILVVEGGQIRIIRADGTAVADLGQGRTPAWSPDGGRVVYANSEGIAVMNADGTGARLLLAHRFRQDTYAPWDMGIGKPAWSPDGLRIAFEHLGDGDMTPAQLFVMNFDGSEPHRLTPTTGNQYAESDPAWSPDGSRIAFWSYGYGIATVPVSGGVPQTLYLSFPTVAYGSRPAWSPDGSLIAFTANRFSRPAIWRVSSSGGPAVTLFEDGAEASWSPDGSRLAFTRTRQP